MTGQLTLGDALRDEGTGRVLRNEDPDWKVHVDYLIWRRAQMGREFTAEDIRADATEGRLGDPHHDNCWGAALIAAEKRGVIRAVGYATAKRPEAHSRPIRVWRAA